MRIIIFSSSTNRSGGTRQAVYQAEELACRGHDVALCLPDQSQMWDILPVPDTAHTLTLHRLHADPLLWRAALERLLPLPGTGPAVVHAFHNKAVKLAAWWGLRWRARGVVCVAHRGVIYRPGNPLPYLSPGMAAIIPNSRACAHMLRWHCPSAKIEVIPNGVPIARITPTSSPEATRAELGLPEHSIVFGCVGNNKPAKGGDVLLRAFAAAKLPDAHLLMAGFNHDIWGPLCAELGIADRVHLLGQTEQVANCLHACDAFVFPSRAMDSAPNTLLEAICLGLPVLACPVGGVPEIIDGNGLLTPVGDVQAMAQGLRTLAHDHAQRKAWAVASHALAARYTMAKRCTALEALYCRLLQARDLLH